MNNDLRNCDTALAEETENLKKPREGSGMGVSIQFQKRGDKEGLSKRGN